MTNYPLERHPMTRHVFWPSTPWPAATRGPWPHDISAPCLSGRATRRPPFSAEPGWRQVRRPPENLRRGSRRPHRPEKPPNRPTHLRIVPSARRVYGMGCQPAERQATVWLHGRSTTAQGIMTAPPCGHLYETHTGLDPRDGVITPQGVLRRLESNDSDGVERDRLPGDRLPTPTTPRRHRPKPTALQHISTSTANKTAAECAVRQYDSMFAGGSIRQLRPAGLRRRAAQQIIVLARPQRFERHVWGGVVGVSKRPPTPAARHPSLPGDVIRPKFAATSHDGRTHD